MDTIVYNGGIGLSVDDQLVCWALRTHYEGVGVLHTEEGHRNKATLSWWSRRCVVRWCRRESFLTSIS